MVEITTMKKCEILFLKSHPKGPQMSTSEIADFLSINENIITSICEETDWTVINQEMQASTTTSMAHSDDEEIDNYSNDGSMMENTLAEQFDRRLTEATQRVFAKEKEDREREKEKEFDLFKFFPFSSFNINSYWDEVIYQYASFKEREMFAIFFCVLAILVYFMCPIRLVMGSDTVAISKEQWIHVCKIDFMEHLDDNLEITKSKANILMGPIDKFYSNEHFTDEKHRNLLKSVDYQKRLKEHLEPLKRDFTVYDYTYHIPEYTVAQSIHALLIEIEDLCGNNKNIHNNNMNAKNIKHNVQNKNVK